MKKYFRSVSAVLGSPLVQAAKTFQPAPTGQHRVLRSTRLEDAAYAGLRQGDAELDGLERGCMEKLPTFPALSRDVYQSFYSLNVRKNPAESLSTPAARFNAPILEEVMGDEDYPVIKAACEGRQLPAYEAAGEFISQVADDLDKLMEIACGEKKTLETLERLEQKRDQSMEKLQKALERLEQSGPDPDVEQQVLSAANRAQSQCNQAEAVAKKAQDRMLQNKTEVDAVISAAMKAAAQKAEEAAAALIAWGEDPGSSDPDVQQADRELLERVARSEVLRKVARYLGRLKELIAGKRKNGYAYGRGEKYSIELGGDINRALASEFALLASPETIPQFFRKLQRKGLKQYRRREPVCKGSGDIICMLDESGSARSQAPWCKAVALALLDVATQDRRRFAMIHFSGREDFKTDLFLPGKYDREDVLQAAETFLDGGTDYVTPLQEALRLMEQEGFEDADMVFITDGACMMPEGFQETLTQEKLQRKFHITGILLDEDSGGFSFSLEPFCDEIYRTSELTEDQIAESLLQKRVA